MEDDKYYKNPRPGETLLIFHDNDDGGNTIHRLAHAMEPGVPLPPYSDGESWTLYDPLREPKYTTYDDKPFIEDVTYTIYSDVKVTGWQHRYGTMNSDQNQKIRTYSNHVNCTQEGSGYKTTLHFKAVRGEYDKAITIKFDSETSTNIICDNHYIYFETWNNGNWTNDPQIKFIKSNGESVTKKLNWVADLEGGGKRWRIMVPEGYHNGKVRFISQNNSNYYPSYDCDIDDQHNFIAYSNESENKLYTNNDSGKDFIGKPETFSGSQLFEGENWTEGTFDSKTGKWTQGKN